MERLNRMGSVCAICGRDLLPEESEICWNCECILADELMNE